MPNLPACKPDGKYQLTFWTVEANPSEDAGVSKAKLARIFQESGDIDKCHVSREVSETGYHHHHVVCKFTAAKRVNALTKKIQEKMSFAKANGSKVSVRVFHPRQGSDEDYPKLMSYITEKKFKEADPDPDGPLEVKKPPCRHCGTHCALVVCSCQSCLLRNPNGKLWCPAKVRKVIHGL